ncbi:MAG: putative sugar O-methyltransferase, partial [Ferrovibrio sp.]
HPPVLSGHDQAEMEMDPRDKPEHDDVGLRVPPYRHSRESGNPDDGVRLSSCPWVPARRALRDSICKAAKPPGAGTTMVRTPRFIPILPPSDGPQGAVYADGSCVETTARIRPLSQAEVQARSCILSSRSLYRKNATISYNLLAQMKFLTPARTTYQTIFEADQQDINALLKFQLFLQEDDAVEKIRNHPQFSASAFWQSLASDLFIGFSLTKVLLCAGYRYPVSLEVPSGISLRVLFSKIRKRLFGSVDEYGKAFYATYPGVDLSKTLPSLMTVSQYPYLRVLEAHSLAGGSIGGRYLEIGAGNAVSIAHLAHVSPGIKFTVVDLPEMMCTAYLLLRVIHPHLTIALPHESSKEADVKFLLPYQADLVPSGEYDFAFNMASLQEMDPGVVNNYMGLFRRALKPGGRVVVVNQEKSRYIEGNTIYAYDVEGFRDVKIQDAPFHTITSGASLGLNVKHLSAVRQ